MEERTVPRRLWINEMQRRKIFCLVSFLPLYILFKKKKKTKEKKEKQEEKDVLGNSSLLHNQKLYLSACKQQNRPISLPTSLSSPSSGQSADENKSSQNRESEEKSTF